MIQQLEKYLNKFIKIYKAQDAEIPVVLVDPAYTPERVTTVVSLGNVVPAVWSTKRVSCSMPICTVH
jgi:hypothetical protein